MRNVSEDASTRCMAVDYFTFNGACVRAAACSGSGFSVLVVVKELNLAPLYTTVDHSRGNDNAAFGGSEAVTRDFCPHPLPLLYRLSSVLHQVPVTARKKREWSVRPGSHINVTNRSDRQKDSQTDRQADGTCTSTCMLTDWKAPALNVRIHSQMTFPVAVTFPMFIESVLENIHSWSFHHMLQQTL